MVTARRNNEVNLKLVWKRDFCLKGLSACEPKTRYQNDGQTGAMIGNCETFILHTNFDFFGG